MTEPSQAQRAFWEIDSRYAHAVVFGDDLQRAAATDARDAFFADHPGESFKVFRPEDIARAFSDDIKPLFPCCHDSEDE